MYDFDDIQYQSFVLQVKCNFQQINLGQAKDYSESKYITNKKIQHMKEQPKECTTDYIYIDQEPNKKWER